MRQQGCGHLLVAALRVVLRFPLRVRDWLVRLGHDDALDEAQDELDRRSW